MLRLLITLFSTLSLFAELAIAPYLTSEDNTFALVDNLVNAQSGKLIQIEKEISVGGSDPLDLIRYYDGGHHIESEFGYGMGISLPLLLEVFDGPPPCNVGIWERQGAMVPFEATGFKDKKTKEHYFTATIDPELFKVGYTNCGGSEMRGEPSSHATQIWGNKKNCIVTLSNGIKRHYSYFKTDGYGMRQYRLLSEDRPNGNKRYFKYTLSDWPLVSSIETKDRTETLILNRINFEYEKYNTKITASNGQTVTFKKKKYSGTYKRKDGSKLSYVHYLTTDRTASHLPNIKYDYSNRDQVTDSFFNMKELKYANGVKMTIEYNADGKVKNVFSNGLLLYTFDFKGNITEVRNALGTLRSYQFNSKRLTKLIEPHRQVENFWSDKGFLTRQLITSPNGNTVLDKNFTYEDNRIKVSEVVGEISQSHTQDRYKIEYIYTQDNIHNLAYEVHNSNFSYHYSYIPNTNLRTSKISAKMGTIYEREFFDYDVHGFLIEHIKDDGSTFDKNNLTDVVCRKIWRIEPERTSNSPGLSLPKVIQEGYLNLISGEFVLLKKHIRSYNTRGFLIEDKVFDENNNFAYTLSYNYNDYGNLTSETNALGEIYRYEYDNYGNKIYEEKHGFSKRFSYNSQNLLTEEVECHGNREYHTVHHYDAAGNRIVTYDRYGKSTWFHYDESGRKIREQDPYAFEEKYEYDTLGNITKKIDKEGHTTSTRYNIYGLPLEIQYPDNSSEHFIYNLHGHLIKRQFRNGSYEIIENDSWGLPVIVDTFSENNDFIKRIKKKYAGKNLISETDSRGFETRHVYDGAGRKIATVEGDRFTQFFYDHLGRMTCSSSESGKEIKIYDLLDRVIEERTEDNQGNIFQKKQYVLDTFGNRTETKIFITKDVYSVSKEIYDTQNRFIRKIEPNGAITQKNYHESDHLEVETIDALGRKNIEIFGANGEIREKKFISAEGEPLTLTLFEYDRLGQKILQKEKVFGANISSYDFTIRYTYDAMGQKSSEVEQNERSTRYTYHKGYLAAIILPDNVVLNHTYDALGQLIERSSSDGSINELFTYDIAGNCTFAKNCIDNIEVIRDYDRFNQRIYERLPSDIELHLKYDKSGRLIDFSFLKEKISYNYNPCSIISATRFHENESLYHYTQTSDFRGKILECSLFKSNVNYSWNESNALTSLNSSTHNETYSYDKIGRLERLDLKDTIGSYQNSFTYDNLDQLISEKGHINHTYSYDCLFNRRTFDGIDYKINKLNLITDTGSEKISYDLVGRRIGKGDATYSYDALGRLTFYKDSCEEIKFEYDPFGRRVSIKKNNIKKHFLYLGDSEIALYDGKIREFRAILGKETPFAVEIDSIPYFPIRNYRGDIVELIGKDGNSQSTYRYDSFGNADFQGTVHCPWQFLGRRLTLGLYHFDKRDYDPCTGRWITPDPAGLIDGPNLYAYVKNNPWSHIDPYGLYIAETKDFVHGLGHGFLDGMSFGAYSSFTGNYRASTNFGYWGESLGTVATLFTPIGLASAEARACVKVVQFTSKALRVEQTLTKAAQTQGLVSRLSCQSTAGAVKESAILAKTLPTTAKSSFTSHCKENFNYTLEQLSNAGRVSDRGGLTVAGRSLDKHGNRKGCSFPKATGNPDSKNLQGQFHLDDIISDPKGTNYYDLEANYYHFFARDGRGARFNSNGTFKGFIEGKNDKHFISNSLY